MLYKFKKILVCSDFSEQSLVALKCAEKLRAATNGEITLLNISGLGVYIGQPDIIFPREIHQNFLNGVHKHHLEKLEELVKQAGAKKVTCVVKEGIVANTIIEYADKGDYQIIIIGHSGTGFFKNFLGGATRKIASASKVPVLIAKKEQLNSVAGLVPDLGSLDKIVSPILDFYRETKASSLKFISFTDVADYQQQIQEEVNHFSHGKEKFEAIVKHPEAYNFNVELIAFLEELHTDVAILVKNNSSEGHRLFLGSTSLKVLESFSGNTLIFPNL